MFERKSATGGAILLGLLAAVGAPDAQATNGAAGWNAAFQRCGGSDVIGPRMIYFGASNEIGPGSVWVRDREGGLGLRFVLKDAVPDAKVRENLVVDGPLTPCTAAASWDPALELPFEPRLTEAVPVPMFASATSATVSIGGWSIDTLKELEFKKAIGGPGVPATYWLDLLKEDRLVVKSAVRVRRAQVTLVFDPAAAAKVRRTHPDGPLPARGAGPGLSIKWRGSEATVVSSPDIYIAGVVGLWRDVAGLQEGQLIVPVAVGTSAPLRLDLLRR